MTKLKSFEDLKGKVLAEVKTSSEEVVFTLEDGNKYKLYHCQDCCESVYLEDIVGETDKLIGYPILMALESSNSYEGGGYESVTWTFYNLATVKGAVTLRWCGSSNGYYSESVDWGLSNAQR